MGLLTWMVMGLIVGLLAKFAVFGKSSGGYVVPLLLGVVGAFVGGWISSLLGFGGIYGFDLRSLLVAFLGTLILQVPYRLLMKRRSQAGNSTPRGKGPGAPVSSTSVPHTGHHSETPACIFVSYRRADSADITGRLYDRLVARFGKENVFKDVDSMPLGADFRRHIESKIAHCSVLLAVIGRQWLTMSEGDLAKPRLEHPNDFVRIELEVALQRGILVVPVLVQGAGIPSEEKLPASLKELAYRHGIEIRPDPDFHRDVDRLIEGLARVG